MKHTFTAVGSIMNYEVFASELYQTLCITKPIANAIELAKRIGIECVPFSKDSRRAKGFRSFKKSFFYDEDDGIIYFEDDMINDHSLNIKLMVEILANYYNKKTKRVLKQNIAYYLSLYMLCPIPLINKLGLDKETLINVFGFDEESTGALLQQNRNDSQTHDQTILECLEEYIDKYKLDA